MKKIFIILIFILGFTQQAFAAQNLSGILRIGFEQSDFYILNIADGLDAQKPYRFYAKPDILQKLEAFRQGQGRAAAIIVKLDIRAIVTQAEIPSLAHVGTYQGQIYAFKITNITDINADIFDKTIQNLMNNN